ncbi:MAG TPA: SMC-Scp complex subunit ScpB [Terriglobales bacterium]
MSLKPKIEALIYAAEEPITLDQIAALLREELLALKTETAVPETADSELEPAAAANRDAAPVKRPQQKSERAELRELLRPLLSELMAGYASEDRGIEIRQVAGGYRMSTKPEHHDVVRAFSKSLKPPVRLSLQALETLAVIAYKQPVTVPEISEIRGVDASAVIGTLLERKLITTAGRKAVVGRPMLYKTSKDFLLRFGLNDLNELPSLEEFEKLAAGAMQEEHLVPIDTALADATGVPDEDGGLDEASETFNHPANNADDVASERSGD